MLRARLCLRRRCDGANTRPPVDQRNHDPVVEEERQVAERLPGQLGEIFQVPCKPHHLSALTKSMWIVGVYNFRSALFRRFETSTALGLGDCEAKCYVAAQVLCGIRAEAAAVGDVRASEL